MILGTESYTKFPMVPKGMSYNPYNNLLLIWGNFLLQRYGAGLPAPHRVGLLSEVTKFSACVCPRPEVIKTIKGKTWAGVGRGRIGEADILKLGVLF